MTSDVTDSTNSDLLTKLSNSSAMKSLTMEQRVGGILRKHGWTVSQSTYYVDPKEGKIREIDVLAEQRWMIPRGDEENDFANLHLVIECKSAKGFHLLFGPETGLVAARPQPHYEWIGYESNKALVAQALAAGQLSETQVSSSLQSFFEVAAPDGMYRNLALRILPPHTVFRASAFRETNISREKDPEASVLWKANLSLMSAVGGLKRSSLKWGLDWIRCAAVRVREGIETAEALKTDFIHSLEEVYIFHPIVVIDSMLWKAESSELEQLKWCRLRFAISGGSDWWSDVVQEDHFASYAAEVTEHYTHCLASNQAQRMGV